MKIYRCKEELRLPVMDAVGRPVEGRYLPVPVGAVFTAEDNPGDPARLESLWGGHPIRISQKTLEKHFDELA